MTVLVLFFALIGLLFSAVFIATIFNLGFSASDPKVGGAPITVGGK